MKFGKRFSQAQGSSAADYLGYKALKQALRFDCIARDALGTRFEQTLARELDKVSRFYSAQEARLQEALTQLQCEPVATIGPGLAALRRQLQELTKYAALNYVAVLKAVKKRNRRLRDACGDRVVTVAPMAVLQREAFFTSRQLLRMSAAAIALDPSDAQAPADGLPEQCPLCRQLVQAPVTLSCTHAFCWGCITMYCIGVLHASRDAPGHGGAPAAAVAPASMSQLTQGWAPSAAAGGGVGAQPSQFECPVCHREQELDIDALTVDGTLAGVLDGNSGSAPRAIPGAASSATVSGSLSSPRSLSARSDDDSTASESTPPAPLGPRSVKPGGEAAAAAAAAAAAQGPLLPAQAPRWRGKLSIVLDIDGTLIASFPPRRVPKLPAHMKTHVVGAGSALNPQGVFVVERPGLGEFLRRIAEFGELSVFTAGLPEYATPILAAIDPGGAFFGDRVICRAGTCAAPEYPCVKDLSRLGRDPARTLIVDDTPLAFLWQPANGVPVLGFRGDPDDNLLLDAVLPLLELAAAAPDVRPFLDRRFGMAAWLTSHGYVPHPPGAPDAATPAAREPAAATDAARAALAAQLAARAARAMPATGPLLLCDFDGTLVDCDVTARVAARLAPDLATDIAAAPSATFVDTMASLLADLTARGVTLDTLHAALRDVGRDMLAAPVAHALHAARADGIASCILSNCNSLFIDEVLKGAGLEGTVHDVVTNPVSGDAENAQISDLAVAPLQAGCAAPDCPLCPPHMCKGMLVQALRGKHSKAVFCCDGANDLCGVLCLQKGDVALVRDGAACHAALQEWQAAPHKQQPVCEVRYWGTPDALAALMRRETGL